MLEHRKEERVNAALPVRLGSKSGITHDVSASGVCFETDEHYAVGNVISLAVEMDAPGGKMLLTCRGEIVRVIQRGERVQVAVRIDESALEAVN